MLLTIGIATIIIVIWYVFNNKPVKKRKINKGDAVIITGCDSGFGYKLTKRLDNAGYFVLATCLTTEGAKRLNQETSNNVLTFQCDVTSQEDVDRTFGEICAACDENSLTVVSLVNNAGIVIGWEFDFASLSDFEKNFSVNFFGLIRVTKKFLPLIKKSKGRIVNVGSISGLGGYPCLTVYGSTKFAVEGFSRNLRLDMKKFGVKVIILNPGVTNTPLWRALPDQFKKHFDEHPDMKDVYGEEYLPNFLELMKTSPPGDPKYVVDALMLALTAQNPKQRYVVGTDALLFRWFTMLPDNVYDSIFSLMKFPKLKRMIE